ncbi:MAG: nitrous oxide reductase family maturation protein NosD [Rhodoferax sp.]|nr:nitrous oxide reductase family maturation protein NosD [Rhodoferax sp.]
MLRWPLLCLLVWTVVISTSSAAVPSLQTLIDATPQGATLRLAPGVYQGPAMVRTPMVIDGAHAATIQGDGRSTVLTVLSSDVTLRGLRLRGSGDSHDRVDAGFQLEGNGIRVEDNDLEDVLFGIHLKSVNNSVIKGNRVTGKPLATGLRGDAIRVWNSHDNRIDGNTFVRARDITLANSPRNHLVNNRFTDGRYGMHLVFSPDVHIEGNHLTHTGTGIVGLYSPGLAIVRNHVAHALTDGGAGIVLKESHRSRVENNLVLHCAVGLKADASADAEHAMVVRGNQFAHNIIGLSFYGEAGGHQFLDNRFESNLTTVVISAPGAGSSNVWLGNAWDEYQGFDRDYDGIGDTAHELLMFADRIWMETPMATFFRSSPALELLDFLERLAPFSSPHKILRDPKPRMH